MYYKPSKHIYLALYNKEIVILDLIKNKFFILDDKKSILLGKIFNSTLVLPGEDKECHRLKQTLINNHLIELTDQPQCLEHFLILNSGRNFIGAKHLNWTMPHLRRVSRIFQILEAYCELVVILFLIKLKRPYKLIDRINTLSRKYKGGGGEDFQLCEELTDSVTKACLIFPWKVKCLEWAIALCTLCQRRGQKASLVIGVQLYPFKSHAWVEINGTILYDDSTLSNNLAIIFKEPRYENS